MARRRPLQERTYRSRIDIATIAIFFAVCVAMLAGVVSAAFGEGAMRAAQAAVIMLAVLGLIVWIAVDTRYTLRGDELLVRSGPVRRRIPIADITAVEPARGFDRLRSSPALSLNRLVVAYGAGKSVIISPADSERFTADLRARQKTRQ